MEQNQRVLYGEIVSRAWEDEEFKKRFLTSPEEVLKEAGITVEEGVEYKVIEAPKLVQYMVLPHEKQQEGTQEMVKLLLAKAEQAQPVVPEGMEVRIVQNTDSVRYLVFPSSPKLLTSAELKMISGGGSVVVVTLEPPREVFLLAVSKELTIIAGAGQQSSHDELGIKIVLLT